LLVLLILKFANTFNFLVNISPSCQSNFIVIGTAVNPTDISVVVADVADVVAVVIADVAVIVDVSGAAVVIVVADVANVVVVVDVGGAAVVVVVVDVSGVNIRTFLSACYHLFNFFVEIIFSLPLIHFLFL